MSFNAQALMGKLGRLVLAVVLVVLMASPIGACGRKGPPEAPPGSTYPQSYPGK